MIGKTISHYKIIEKLGSGGMGVVYKAKDTKLDRFVALKFLPAHLSQAEDKKKRFIHEAKAASALDHPNICTIYEIDETEDGQMFIAMACYEGQSLKDKIERGPLPLDEALDIATQIAEGLGKAHSKKIIHRDIKPANILITEDGQVKIVDFGLAKLAGQTTLTKERTIMGTVAYMSPEQAQGTEVDHRTDIWALGVVLYEMVTARQPFEGDYVQEVIYSILNEEPEPLTSIRSELPEELEDVVQKALQKDPEERYERLSMLLAHLKTVKIKLDAEEVKTHKVKEKPTPSIAVLPFVNMSPDPENEYFSDGLAEELINALTKLEGLRVAARTSAFRFKGKDVDIREIGKQLNVSTVLEGSVRKAGNRLRITVQLINVEDGYHLWSEKYDRELEDVFAIQDDIAMTIVDKLKVQLLGEEQQKLVKRYTHNLEAYNLYLRGRFYWNKRTEKGLKKAIDYFNQAIEIDSHYALAYAGLADSYNFLGAFGIAVLPPGEAMPKGKALAIKALEIDDDLSEPHTSLAFVSFYYDWDWLNAEREFKRTIALNPNYPQAHQWYSHYLMASGRADEAFAEAKRAQELDPLAYSTNVNVGWIFYWARRYQKAIEHLQKTVEMEPGLPLARQILGLAYEQNGLFDEAIDEFQKAVTLSESSSIYLAALGHGYAVSGQRREATKILDKLKEMAKQTYVPPYWIAEIYAGLGENEQAFEWLQKAYEERSGGMVWLKVNPKLDSLRSDPRFAAFLKKMRLPL